MKVSAVLSEILEGRRMQPEEFLFLFYEADLFDLAQAASRVRDRLFPNNLVTFIIDRNINYTNVCSCGCRFCAFYRPPGSEDGYVITEDELFVKIREALDLGATQVMIQGGLHPELDVSFFEKMFRSIKDNFNITVHSLSAPEIAHIAKVSGLTTRETLQRLVAAGLDSLPGGGAEILHDEVRSFISPNKIKSQEWLRIMEEAHEIGLKTTATMMMGSVEVPRHRLAHLEAIRSLQDRTGGFRAFILWTYQPGNNELMGSKVTSLEYLRTLALSRLYLDNIRHIQGSWVTQGEHVGQLSVFFGADDLGSIMIEENVVRATGLSYKMSRERMIEIIRKTGKTPALRDTAYNVLEVYGEPKRGERER